MLIVGPFEKPGLQATIGAGETPVFITLDLWLPISLHINPVDDKTWGCMQMMTWLG